MVSQSDRVFLALPLFISLAVNSRYRLHQHNRFTMLYSVWLITRPISMESRLSALGISSDGKAHLRHWGVLVSELTLLDIQVILQWTRYSGNDDTPLGTMYELCREEGRYTNVNIVRPFGMEIIRREWGSFSADFVGTTEMAYEDIKREGNPKLELVLISPSCPHRE